MSQTFYKPAVTKANGGCLNCGAPPVEMEPDSYLGVGFGQVSVDRDDEVVWCGDGEKDASEFTARALAEPDHDWRITFEGPLHGETYQMQDGKWIMIESNMGFA